MKKLKSKNKKVGEKTFLKEMSTIYYQKNSLMEYQHESAVTMPYKCEGSLY